ncbi:hypothetical protein AMECASPLE_015859 [Ameca splendens]|uniref:Uncharacterized protein n=1 Tax=Ameca splendens TaxID=208324 RepID=A0ABV0ZYT6_9TELE
MTDSRNSMRKSAHFFRFIFRRLPAGVTRATVEVAFYFLKNRFLLPLPQQPRCNSCIPRLSPYIATSHHWLMLTLLISFSFFHFGGFILAKSNFDINMHKNR